MERGDACRAVVFLLFPDDKERAHRLLLRRNLTRSILAPEVYMAAFDSALVDTCVKLLWPLCWMPWFLPYAWKRVFMRYSWIAKALRFLVLHGVCYSAFDRMDCNYRKRRGGASVDVILQTITSCMPPCVPLRPSRSCTGYFGTTKTDDDVAMSHTERCMLCTMVSAKTFRM